MIPDDTYPDGSVSLKGAKLSFISRYEHHHCDARADVITRCMSVIFIDIMLSDQIVRIVSYSTRWLINIGFQDE
jgi:hypothetical protein